MLYVQSKVNKKRRVGEGRGGSEYSSCQHIKALRRLEVNMWALSLNSSWWWSHTCTSKTGLCKHHSLSFLHILHMLPCHLLIAVKQAHFSEWIEHTCALFIGRCLQERNAFKTSLLEAPKHNPKRLLGVFLHPLPFKHEKHGSMATK